MLLPPSAEGEEGALLKHLHGLILSGGADVAPLFFGEEPKAGLREVDPERDRFEIALTREALKRDLPQQIQNIYLIDVYDRILLYLLRGRIVKLGKGE